MAFFFVHGRLGLKIVTGVSQGINVSHFFWIASVVFGHQKPKMLLASNIVSSDIIEVRIIFETKIFFQKTQTGLGRW